MRIKADLCETKKVCHECSIQIVRKYYRKQKREKSTGMGNTPWRNDCWKHQSSAKQMDKGLSSVGKCQVGILTLHDSPALISTQILDFTRPRFFSPLWGWGWRRGFCLNPSSETSFLLSRTPNGLLRWKCAMLSVALNNLLLFVGRPCSLITHCIYSVFGGQQLLGGQRPQSAAFLTRKWQEIGLSDWRALSTDNETMNSSLPSEKDLHTPVQPCAWPSQETSHLSCRMREQIANIQ